MSDRTEGRYYEFRDFDLANAQRVLSFYTSYFPTGPVLELACGTGVFLTQLRENGIAARGVDLDPGMVEIARRNGNDVILADAVAHLETLPDASLHGLFAAHFLEHLPAERVQDVYTEAARVLVDGGLFVAAVPNAASLSVLTGDFWRDPTHVRFYDPVALEYFADTAGLKVIETGANPRNDPGPPPLLHNTLPAEPTAELTQAIRALVDGLDVDEDPAMIKSVYAIGHLLGVLDDRFQQLQHAVRVQHDSHERLLTQLYPPNEVYVAARKGES